MRNPAQTDRESVPWWRVGVVWLVIGGPVAAIVTSVVAAALAVSGADRVVAVDGTSVPALKARNHAADPQR